jgi:hypothetical protein
MNRFVIMDSRSVGLCSHVDPFDSPRFYYGYGLYEESLYQLCTEDTRLRFVFLQGGTHFLTNSSMTITQYLQPSLKAMVISTLHIEVYTMKYSLTFLRHPSSMIVE